MTWRLRYKQAKAPCSEAKGSWSCSLTSGLSHTHTRTHPYPSLPLPDCCSVSGSWQGTFSRLPERMRLSAVRGKGSDPWLTRVKTVAIKRC